MHDNIDEQLLAEMLCGITEHEDHPFDVQRRLRVAEVLWDRYEIELENFERLVNDLLPFTIRLQSPLSGTRSHAFGINEDTGGGVFRAIVRRDAD